jgi:hypothetical protein
VSDLKLERIELKSRCADLKMKLDDTYELLVDEKTKTATLDKLNTDL